PAQKPVPSGGTRLPDAQRGTAERMYGQSFSDVRLFQSTALTIALGGARARGVAHEGSVYLRDDVPRPGTIEGDLILAHELAHVARQRTPGAGASSAVLERQADTNAVLALDGTGSPSMAYAEGPLRPTP